MFLLVLKTYLETCKRSLKPGKDNINLILFVLYAFLMCATNSNIRDMYGWIAVLYLTILFLKPLEYSKMLYIIPGQKKMIKSYMLCYSFLMLFVGLAFDLIYIIFVFYKMPQVMTEQFWITFIMVIFVNSILSITTGIPYAFHAKSMLQRIMTISFVLCGGALYMVYLLGVLGKISLRVSIIPFIILILISECYRWILLKNNHVDEYQLPAYKNPDRKKKRKKGEGVYDNLAIKTK